MRCLARQMESLQTILKSLYFREILKKYTIECKTTYFEYERSEKLFKKIESSSLDLKIIELSKELRNSIKVSDFTQHSVPIAPPPVPTQLKLTTELPIKRIRPEVQKKSDLSFDIALICCRFITEGEKLRLWPLIDPKRGEPNEISYIPNHSMQLHHEEKLKMRGRIIRGTKKIAIDRLIMNDCEHSWGRYKGIKGTWHNLESEAHTEFYDDEENEACQRLHKLFLQGYRNFNRFRIH